MLSLIVSISCSVAVSVLLKVAHRQAIQIEQAIAVNYPVAALLCFTLLQPELTQLRALDTAWWTFVLLGVLLPSVFLAMAAAVRHAGIIVSDAAQRLSLLIPLAASFLLFGQTLSTSKISGIALALLALVCLLWRAGQTVDARPHTSLVSAALLLCVWAGYGVIDVLFKQMAGSAIDFSASLLLAFVLAGLLMGSWLILRRTHWQGRSMAAGLLLGALNFGNVYFYLRAHQHYPGNPALVFVTMNIGVISLGTLTGAWLFKEPLSTTRLSGLAFALIAVGLLR